MPAWTRLFSCVERRERPAGPTIVTGSAGRRAPLPSLLPRQQRRAGSWQSAAGQRAPPRVALRCGVAEGAWERGLAAFRGIPFGAPPVGERRWKPAAPAECWAPEVLNATQNGNICYQGGGTGQSEDCLNLNVFVPADRFPQKGAGSGRAGGLPVLVWIYGGGNYQGSVSLYGEIENIVRKKEVVLVAMNYRLNAFGYLALRELAEADPRGVSGNYGITDQQLALRWVQENIASFGGAADRVTIMGHSSGASNVHAHLASASSKGLFHRGISLSGSSNLTMDRARKEAQDRRLFLDPSPCSHHADVLSCLYNMSTHDLWEALPESYSAWSPLYDYPVDAYGLGARVSALLYVDGVTVTHPLEAALQEGLNDVPVLLQNLQAEMDCYPDSAAEVLTMSTLPSFFNKMFTPGYGASMPQEVLTIYGKYSDPAYAVYAVDSDTALSCGLRQLALSAKLGHSSPVYWGVVKGSPSQPFQLNTSSIPSRFPFHSWDVVAASETWGDYAPSDEDRRFGEMLLDQWVALATAGTLSGAMWTPVQDAGMGQVYGSDVGKAQARPILDMKVEECTFWSSVGVGKNWWWLN